VGSGPNTVTPVVTHPYPILTSGSAHPVVHELGRKLGDLGFPNSASRGANPFGAVDESVLSAVGAFRQAYGVQPDPSGFGGNTQAAKSLAENHLDPWTVEAILRAHDQDE
jgi:peptidoglycan hydrolase-like protein with peptidoglycan-binding domain